MCKRDGVFSGGLAVVAANTRDEAFEVFHTSREYGYMIDCSDYETGEYTEDITRCDSLYYKREDWFEVPCLTADTLVQKLIAEAGHSE